MRVLAIIAAGLVSFTPAELLGQRIEPGHRHLLSLFVGAATSSQRHETAITVGPTYRFLLTRHIGLGPILEMTGYRSETSTLVLGGVFLRPYRGIELTLAPGVEWITGTAKPVESMVERGEFTFRFAAAYDIRTRRGYRLSPDAAVNLGAGVATVAYGLSFGVSF